MALPLLLPEDQTSQTPATSSLGGRMPLLMPDTPAPVSTEAIRQNLHFTKGVNPDQAAEDHHLGQASGFSPDLVSRNRDEIRSRVESDSIVAKTAGLPGTQQYLADQRNMAISKDDIGHLANTEDQFRQYLDRMPKQEWWKDVIQPTPARALAQYNKGVGGIYRWLGEGLGSDWLQAVGRDLTDTADAVDKQIATEHPLDAGTWKEATSSALSSMYLQAPSMTLGFLGGTAKAAAAFPLAMMGVTTGGQTYAERRDAGFSPMASAFSGVWDGVVEVGTELLPTKTFFEMMKPAAKMGFGKLALKVGELYGEEMLGESTATFLQDINAKFMGDPNMTTQQRVDQIGEYFNSGEAYNNWISTLKSTFVQTSLMGGAGAGMNRIANRKYQDVQHAERDAAMFSSLEELAAGSKTRQRLPAAYEAFVNFAQEQAGGKVANVFVDAELLQSAMPAEQLTELLDKVDISKETFAESVQTGSAVVIPISKYLAHVAGTEVSQAIRGDLRFREDGLSLNEAADARNNWAENMQGLIDEDRRITESNTQFDEEGQQVHDDIYAKLMEAGQDKDVAEANAVAWRAFAVTAPTRYEGYYGATPAEVYQKLVPQVQAQTFADHQAGNGLDTSAFNADNVSYEYDGNGFRATVGEHKNGEAAGAQADPSLSKLLLHESPQAQPGSLGAAPQGADAGDSSLYQQVTPADIASAPFKEWFGNSKATNKGQPLAFYHGSNSSTFYTFDKNQIGAGGHTSSGLGFFFSPSRQAADHYAGDTGFTHKVFIRAENPYVMSLKEAQSFDTVADSKAFREQLQAQGYDSIFISDKSMAQPYAIVFEPNQIKSVANNGQFDNQNPDIRYQSAWHGSPTSESLAPIYSKLLQISELFSGMKAQGVENFLAKQGVKKAEMEAVGIKEFLAAKKPTDKVTQSELVDFVKANTVELEDVVLGGKQRWNEETAKEFDNLGAIADSKLTDAQRNRLEELDNIHASSLADATSFSQYTEPGAEPNSYREMFVTAPNPTGKLSALEEELRGLNEKSWRESLSEKEMSRAAEIQNKIGVGTLSGKLVGWSDGHSQYSEVKNPIVRIRFNEVQADGKRLLRIEEMQGPDPDNQAKMPGYLKDNIYQLGVKRILAYAKENGFDGVALAAKPGMSAGETQADRYSLEKHISEIAYWKEDDGEAWGVSLLDQNGDTIDGWNPNTNLSAKEIEAQLGKEIARQIIEDSGDENPTASEWLDKKTGKLEEGVKVIQGDNLRVGGEGLKHLYDNQLPAMLEAYGKGKMEAAPYRADATPHRSLAFFLDWAAENGDTRSRAELGEAWGRGVSDKTVKKFMESTVAATMSYLPLTDKTPDSYPLFQDPNAPRGAFTVQDGKPLIKLFETANPSTFLHETGHTFFTFMEQMAARDDAPQALKDDWQTLVDYAGSKDGKLANEHHETLARALETYFMEGTAPSPKLRSIFQQFAVWLKAIYRQVSALKAPVNDDIRQVFDRMFATDTEIEQAKAYYSAKEDFLSVAQVEDAAAAEKYRKLRAKADEDAGDTRLRKYTKAYMQALGGKKELEAKARAEINAQPAYAAPGSAVAAGGFSADMLDALLGKEKRTQLAKRRVGLITQKGGADIDAVMAAHGYENPTDMFDAILAAENKTVAVDRLVKDRTAQMQETIRKDLADGPVAADSDYHSDSRMAVLIAEVELINKKRNLAAGRDKGAIRRLEVQAIRDAARQVLQSKTVTEATSYYQYSRAEAKAAKQAMDAFKTGDFDNAERFKRRELLNHALVLESIKAKEDVASIEGRFNRAVDRKNVDSSYHAQALRFLMVNGLTQRRIAVPENTKSFEAFLEGLRHEDADSPMAGSVPVWSEWAMTGKETKGGWRKNFSLAELQEADSIVRWLVETGADLRNGRLAEYQQTIDEIVQTAIAPAASLKSKHIYGETHPMRRGSVWVQKYLADHTQLMFIFDSLDGFKAMVKKGTESFGPNRTLIGHKLADAQDARDRLQKEVRDKLLAPIRQLAKSASKHGKSIPGLNIPETMRKDGRVWTYERVVAAALNMGNPTNTMRVASGYGLVTDDEVSLAAGNLDGLTKKEMVERLQQVRSQLSLSKLTQLTSKTLTAEDWGAVQEIWNVVNGYWDRLDEVHHKVNHFHREKVQARPFQVMLADGTAIAMDGGYYPLKYDRILSDQVAEWSEQDDLFNESVFGHPGVESGMVKSRVAGPVRMPVDLSLSVLFTHMEDVIHYITHAAIIKDVDRITRDATYAEVVKDKLGREAYHAIRPILRNIAKPDRAVGLHLDTMFDRMRVLSSAYVLGLNSGVAVKQLFSIPSMWHDIGFGNWLRGVKHVMTSPVAAYQAMQELSPYLATRATSFDREVRDSANAIMGKGFGMDKTRRDQLRDIAFLPIQVMDMISVYPSWWAAFNAERARGGDEKAAVRYADEMIRASQPTSKAMEQAKVLYTRNGMTRFFSMFMTFSVNYGNRQQYFYRGWKEGKISTGEFTKWVALDAIAPVLLQNIVLGALWGGAGGDDDRSWADSALDVLLYQFSGLVFVRDAAGMAISGFKKHILDEDAFLNNLGESAVLTGFKLAERSYTTLLKMVDDLGDDEKMEKAIWAFSEIASYWAGIPVAKMVRNIKEGMRQHEEEDGTLFNVIAPDPQKRRRK